MKVHGLQAHDRRPTVLSSAVGLGVGLGCGLAWGVILVATPSSAADRAPAPMLSIDIDDGRTAADVGDSLDYTITIDNTGPDAVDGLRVTQTVPDGLAFGSADARGAVRKGLVVWSVDLDPGRTRVLHTTMTVGETPDDVLRMASVACASLSTGRAPLVCAAHSDELPAGGAARSRDEAVAAEAGAASTADDGSAGLRVGFLGGGAAVLVAAALTLRRFRRRAATAH